MNRIRMFCWAASLLAAVGCASEKSAAPAPAAGGGPEWHLDGTRLIACCCASPCSCRINKPPMQAHGCEYTTAVHVAKGRIGKTRMDGFMWAQVGLGFAEEKPRNWVVVYVSDKATEEQFKAFTEWMVGGIKALDAKGKVPFLAGAIVGFKKVPMTWNESKNHEEFHTTISTVLDLQIRAIRNPGHPEPVRSIGVLDDFGNSFIHCETLTHTFKDSDPDVKKYDGWDLKGRQANLADFSIGSDVQSSYTLGWGCWSAHKDLGATDTYQERMLGHPKK
jgi:hypothetical protein